ncbi:MAG: sodium:solute symporter family transporter [Planctomycetota bacterium]
MGATLCLIVLIFALLPLYRASGIYTMPQLLKKRFGESTHLFYSVIAILATCLTLPVGTNAMSKTLSALTGLNLWWFAAVIVPVCVGLAISGGLTTVAYSNVVMGVIILGGGAIMTHQALGHEAVGGLAGLTEKLAASQPVLLEGFRKGGDIPWEGVFGGVFLIGVWFWCIDQPKVQMVLAAKTLNDGRRGALLVGMLKYIAAFVALTPGMCGRLIYPGLGEPDKVYGMLLRDLFGPGLRGLMVAGLAAAVISTLTSLLTAVASIFTNDIYRRFVDDETFKRTAVRSGRGFLLAAGAWTLLGIVFFSKSKTVLPVVLKIFGVAAGPTLAAFIVGVFWRRANRLGANVGLAVGIVFSSAGGIAEWAMSKGYTPPEPLLSLAEINSHNRCVIAFLLTAALIAVVSLLSAPPEPERLEQTTFAWYLKRRKEVEANAAGPPAPDGTPRRDPWYLDYRLWAAAMLVLLLATWWKFGLYRIATGFVE